MAHYEPPHQDLGCLQIQLFSSLVVKELNETIKIAVNGLKRRIIEIGEIERSSSLNYTKA